MKKMTNEENKKRWKDEANQLKEDLKNRKKVIKKREVSIKFPKNQSSITSNNKTPSNGKKDDDHFRNQINFSK